MDKLFPVHVTHCTDNLPHDFENFFVFELMASILYREQGFTGKLHEQIHSIVILVAVV